MMVNEIVKLYSEGSTIHQAIHRGVGQQSQLKEKDYIWRELEPIIDKYEYINKKDTKKEYDDKSLLDFLFGFSDELSFQAKYKQTDEILFTAEVVSKMLEIIIEGART